jgi:hypothetical protein
MILATTILQAAESDGLTIGEILADIPHDGPAIVLYLLTAASAALIWWGHRRSSANDPASTGQSGQPGAGTKAPDAASGTATRGPAKSPAKDRSRG